MTKCARGSDARDEGVVKVATEKNHETSAPAPAPAPAPAMAPAPPPASPATAGTRGERVPVAYGPRGLRFEQLDEAIRFANGLVHSGMAPKGMTAGGVVAIIQAGAEVGMPPMWSLAHLTFVRGRLGIDGTASLALVRRDGVCAPDAHPTFTWSGEPYTPEWTAIVTARRRDSAQPVSESFSLAEAIRMGLVRLANDGTLESRKYDGGWTTESAWAKAARDMLQWRAWGRLAKREFSDVTMGMTLTEELEIPLADEVAIATAKIERSKPEKPELGAGGGLDPLLESIRSAGQVEDAETVPLPEGPT